MSTATIPQSLPVIAIESLQLQSAGDLNAALNVMIGRYGTDLDAHAIRTEVAALDRWLVDDLRPSAHNTYISQLDDDRVAAGVAAVTLCQRLGAPLDSIDTPKDPPALGKKRDLHPVEVLVYRHVAASHHARAAAQVGALEQGATSVELASLELSDAAQQPHGVDIDLPGNDSKDPARITLPTWTGATLDRITALMPEDGEWLLTGSKAEVDGRNSAIMMDVRWVLKKALGWTRPSPAAITLAAARRAHSQSGFTAAHALLRYRNVDNTSRILGL